MPLNRDAYTRYRLLDARLRKKPQPTLEDLIHYLSEQMDKPIAKRTVQLDIQDMRYNQSLRFDAPIEYNRKTGTYYYTNPDYSIHHLPVTAEDLHGLDFAISILDQFKELPAIREFEDAIKKIAYTVRYNREQQGEGKVIHFDRPNSYRGIEFIETVVRAIREKRRLRLHYRKFEEVTLKEHILEPYMVREFKSRFYLIGNVLSAKGEKVLTFAFDRIVAVQLTEKTFEGKFFDAEKFYQSVFGITAGTTEAVEIHLRFSPLQGRYILSQPLHHSQVLLKETKNEVRVSLRVSINHELVMQLLSYGAEVKILQPKCLAMRIKTEAQKMAGLYM